LGTIVIGQVSTHAEVSALWAFAYLEDRMPSKTSAPLASLLEDTEGMDREIALTRAYNKLRYLDILEIPLAAFELREVIDRFLLDLGLRPDRHGRKVNESWWTAGWRAWCKEWFTSYVCSDYKGMIDEYLEVLQKSKDKP
jgi:hypothetical protein